MKGVVDTDILLKMAHYGLLAASLRCLDEAPDRIGVLGAARFMARRRLSKLAEAELLDEMEACIQDLQIIEPSEEELIFAAEIELQATKLSVDLDEGESILCAVAVYRSLEWIATGDKRAVVAIETLMQRTEDLRDLAGKVLCLENLVLRLLLGGDPQAIRSSICGKPSVDKALAICFSCTSATSSPQSWFEGLSSYVAGLHRQAPTALRPVTSDGS